MAWLETSRTRWHRLPPTPGTRRPNRSSQFFHIVAGEILDRYTGGAREPERVNQALDPALADPIIDGLTGHPADGRHRTRATGKSDGRGDQIGPGYPLSSHPRSPGASRDAGSDRPLSTLNDIGRNPTMVFSSLKAAVHQR